MKKEGIAKKVSNPKLESNNPASIKIGIKANGKNINGKTMKEAFFDPYVLIRVRVPVFLSASLSIISFVMDPPVKKNIEIRLIDKGKDSKALPKTLHDARIPNNPRGIPTHN